MKYVTVYFAIYVTLFFLNFTVFKASAKESEVYSSFQNQIKECDFGFSNLKSIKNFSGLYSEIQKKYILLSERTLYRELFYQIKSENRKIKITNDKLEIFKIGENEKHTLLNIDLRHKLKTVQAQVSQLIFNAKTEKDWNKSLENRENGLKIEIVRVDDRITQMKVTFEKTDKALDCQFVNTSEICLCNKSAN